MTIFITCIMFLLSPDNTNAQTQRQLVRLAVIDVDPNHLNSYCEFLREEIEASIRIEPGVLTLYAVADQDRPTHVTIFETYADSSQYRAHLTTPHFQKYKTGTLQMVKDLRLIETEPILYVRNQNVPPDNKDLLIRLVELEVDPAQLKNYKNLVEKVMKPGVNKEAGIVTMYGLAEKAKPTHIAVLEIYADVAAYNAHVKTPHFLKYKNDSKDMVKSLKIIEVLPIFLGTKPVKTF